MKTLLKLGCVLVILLFALTACNLYQAINVGWTIVSYTAGSIITVTYDVWNAGKYDLTGVNLHFSVYASAGVVGYYDAWTPDFSLNKDQYITGDTFTMDISPGALGLTGYVEVIGVDMDKPKG